MYIAHVSANRSPRIDVVNVMNATLGEEVQLNVTSSDIDGDEVNLTLAYDLPVGAAFDPTIGNFVWTPRNMEVVNIS